MHSALINLREAAAERSTVSEVKLPFKFLFRFIRGIKMWPFKNRNVPSSALHLFTVRDTLRVSVFSPD